MPVLSEIQDARASIKLWVPAAQVEAAALRQLENTANLPFVFKHVAVMPDVHLGIGATVGSVVATRGAIVPACVGVDIGCGMMAVKLPLEPLRVLDKAKDIRAHIESAVPLGFDGNAQVAPSAAHWPGWDRPHSKYLDEGLLKKSQHQMGSLGSGNHFIEVCLDQNEDVWVMLHTRLPPRGQQPGPAAYPVPPST